MPFVILSAAKDLSLVRGTFFGAGARSFATLRTTVEVMLHSLSLVILSVAKDPALLPEAFSGALGTMAP